MERSWGDSSSDGIEWTEWRFEEKISTPSNFAILSSTDFMPFERPSPHKKCHSPTDGMDEIHNAISHGVYGCALVSNVDHHSRGRTERKQRENAVILQTNLARTEVSKQDLKRGLDEGIGQEGTNHKRNALSLHRKDKTATRQASKYEFDPLRTVSQN